MKNIKAVGLLLLALGIGLAAAVYAAGWVSQQGGVASNKVVVAVVDIELGSKLNPQMLSTIDWPSGSVPSDAFKEPKDVQDRVVKVGVLRGEAIVERKLAPAGTQGGLSSVIADGKRAMTVRVNDVVGVAGFALPGNYVDVMVNAQQEKDKGEEGKQISKTVLEHVLVLAVAQEAGRDDTKPKVVSAVTLELTLQDSEKLDLARSVGTLSLVLRNQVDQKTVATAGVTKNQLLGVKEAPPAKAPIVNRRLVRLQSTEPSPSVPPPSVPPPSVQPPSVPPPSVCVEVIQYGTRALNCFQPMNLGSN